MLIMRIVFATVADLKAVNVASGVVVFVAVVVVVPVADEDRVGRFRS